MWFTPIQYIPFIFLIIYHIRKIGFPLLIEIICFGHSWKVSYAPMELHSILPVWLHTNLFSKSQIMNMNVNSLTRVYCSSFLNKNPMNEWMNMTATFSKYCKLDFGHLLGWGDLRQPNDTLAIGSITRPGQHLKGWKNIVPRIATCEGKITKLWTILKSVVFCFSIENSV